MMMHKEATVRPHQLVRWPVLRQYGPLALAVVAIGYPIARILLPGTARWAMLIPLLLLLLWYGWRVVRPAGVVQSPLGLPVLASAAALAISSVFGVAEPPAIAAALFDWLEVFVILFLVVALLAAGWRPQVVFSATLLVVSVVLLTTAGILVYWWTQWAALWQPGDPWLPVSLRIGLPETHPNQTALLVNIGVPLVIAALWRARRRWQVALWGGWLLLAVLVVFFTSSRGSWLGLFTASATMLLPLLWSALRGQCWRRLWTTLLLAGGYTALFVTLLLVNLQAVQSSRLAGPVSVAPAASSATTPTASPAASPTPAPTATPVPQQTVQQTTRALANPSGRTVFWSRALEFFVERPLFGVGPNGYAAHYRVSEPNSVVFAAPHAHSVPLQVLSEMGAVGAAALAWLALTALWIGWHGWRAAAPLLPAPDTAAAAPVDRPLLLACLAALAGLLAQGLVEVPHTFSVGMVLYLLAAALVPGGGWRLTSRQASTAAWPGRLVTAPPALHVVLVGCAVLAWGSAGAMLLHRNAQEALEAQARVAIHLGQPARALALYEQGIAQAPWNSSAYSGRAVALAALAQHDPQRLPAALAAQELAARHDPANPATTLNQVALLAAMGQRDAAEAELRAFLETHRSSWAAPYVLLARLHEQANADEAARDAWRIAFRREPVLSESAACLRSRICLTMPYHRRYAALAQARQLAIEPDAAALREIERLARSWRNVDIWAVGALAAERAGDTRAAERLLQGALDESQNVAKEPTMQLAIVLLRDALARNDEAALRTLIDAWMYAPDEQMVPQIERLLVTTTEAELAQTLAEAAAALDDPARKKAAARYVLFVRAALPE
jgi:tetratricopeptide (TPR) repeat protein/O-antigen ligase